MLFPTIACFAKEVAVGKGVNYRFDSRKRGHYRFTSGQTACRAQQGTSKQQLRRWGYLFRQDKENHAWP